jgi:large subunit ribosomal protein L30
MPGKLRVTQVKSTISHIARNRATVRALGLKRIGHTVEVTDNDATRGMVRQVRFLVTVEEVPGTGDDTAGARTRPGRGGGQPKDAPSEPRAATTPSEDRGDAPASHRSEDSEDSEAGEEKT